MTPRIRYSSLDGGLSMTMNADSLPDADKAALLYRLLCLIEEPLAADGANEPAWTAFQQACDTILQRGNKVWRQ